MFIQIINLYKWNILWSYENGWMDSQETWGVFAACIYLKYRLSREQEITFGEAGESSWEDSAAEKSLSNLQVEFWANVTKKNSLWNIHKFFFRLSKGSLQRAGSPRLADAKAPPEAPCDHWAGSRLPRERKQVVVPHTILYRKSQGTDPMGTGTSWRPSSVAAEGI